MRIHQWLKVLAERKGSDLYLATGAPPCAKFEGELKTISSDVLGPGEVAEIANELMDDTQREEFARDLEMNLAGCLDLETLDQLEFVKGLFFHFQMNQ